MATYINQLDALSHLNNINTTNKENIYVKNHWN